MSVVQWWDVLILLAMFYCASVTPYELGVLRGELLPPVLNLLNICVDCVFICDLYVLRACAFPSISCRGIGARRSTHALARAP